LKTVISATTALPDSIKVRKIMISSVAFSPTGESVIHGRHHGIAEDVGVEMDPEGGNLAMPAEAVERLYGHCLCPERLWRGEV